MSEQSHLLSSNQHFALPPEALTTFQNLSTIARHYPLITNHPDELHEQPVVYFDTADYRLLRTGFAVYVVQDQEQTLLTVENLAVILEGKVDKQISRRQRVTEVITSSEVVTTLKAWPKSLRKAVAPVVGRDTKFQPMAASHYAPTRDNPVVLQPQMLMADACRLLWREQLLLILLNEAGVRYSQESEYVHEMRVAIRRMRAVAKLYGGFLPRKTIRPFLAYLRKTGRLLGHIRNLDVTLAKARRLRNQEGQAVKASKKLLKAWRQQRQTAQQKLIHWLDSSEYSDFITEFQYFCVTPESQRKHHLVQAVTATPQQVRHVMPSQIFAGYAAVRCYEALFDANAPVDYTVCHNLRIACKYLRYNLEFARPLLSADIDPLITRLKGLQDLLGDLNDAVIAQKLIDEAKQVDTTDPYQRAQAQRTTELSEQVPQALAALIDQESRTQLMTVLAAL